MGLKAGDFVPIAGDLVDTATGGVFAGLAGKRNRKFAREMYWREREDSLADWNMINAYNSPKAQMARLKEAGLNPNLVYGDGGSIMQAATVRSSDATMGNETPMTGTRLGDSMRKVYDIKLANAQLTSQKLMQANLEQDLANKKATETLTYTQAGKEILGTAHSKFDLDRKNELALQMIEDAWAKTGLTKAQIDAVVQGNQREEQLQPYRVKMAGKLNTEKDWDIANKQAENAMRQMENGQYDIMRPIQLAKATQEVEHLLAQIANTKQETKNTEQVTRLNKMEADMGKVLRYIRDIAGGAKEWMGPKVPKRNPVGFK